MNYSIHTIAEVIQAKEHSFFDENFSINSVLIDTRQATIYHSALFIAIVTKKSNGHLYIQDAYKKGVRNFLISEKKDEYLFEDANYVIVDDTIRAIQKLASFHRSKFQIPVIGITGSNGKTVVKEWLYELLKNNYHICRSPKSFNSQIGVPLSVLNLDQTHELAIFEAGISEADEMSSIASVINPNIAVLTSFGQAHSLGFSSEHQKLIEKLNLFQNAETKIIQRYKNEFLLGEKLNDYVKISDVTQDEVVVQAVERNNNTSSIILLLNKEQYQISIPFLDDASVNNAITCFVVIYYLNKNLISTIIPLFKNLQPISLRMEVKRGIFQSLLINDFYNSDIDSFEIALSYLFQHFPMSQKVLILSDFEQVKYPEQIFNKAIQLLNDNPPHYVFFIGREWANYQQIVLKSKVYYFPSSENFLDTISKYSDVFVQSTILLKGARNFEFEKLASYFQLKSHDTVLEVNISSLWNNLKYYKSLVGNSKIMCMLKATGYGSGTIEMAYALQKFGVDYIAVAYADEGIELKDADLKIPIMVMLPEEESIQDIIQYKLEPEIYSFKILDLFIAVLEKLSIKQFPIHLKFDTGMHRLGFDEKEVDKLLEIIKKTNCIEVKSIFSHLSASESDEHRQFTLQQIQTFQNIAQKVEAALGYKVIKHICNSAAIQRYPEARMDMVRVGIGMYGISDNKSDINNLQNVLTLKTKIAQIKILSENETIGYGRAGVMNNAGKIAVIPIGYADGFSRRLSNGNFNVKIKNKYYPIIGRVCMDMSMIDVSNSDVKEGDEVIIFDNIEDIQKIAQYNNTISYEVLTSVSQRVKRVYIYD